MAYPPFSLTTGKVIIVCHDPGREWSKLEKDRAPREEITFAPGTIKTADLAKYELAALQQFYWALRRCSVPKTAHRPFRVGPGWSKTAESHSREPECPKPQPAVLALTPHRKKAT